MKKLLPNLRAGIVRALSQEYGMKQQEIAEALGITQASVSQYLATERGRDTELFKSLPGCEDSARKIAEEIYEQRLSREGVMLRLCGVCSQLRHSEEFCDYHQLLLNPEILFCLQVTPESLPPTAIALYRNFCKNPRGLKWRRLQLPK